MPVPVQPSGTPPANDPSGTGTPPAANPPAPAPAAAPVDLSKIPADQLAGVLENPNVFKLPRIADALKAEKELKDLKAKQSAADDANLTEQKKFEDLAEKRKTELEAAQQTIKDQGINNTLTIALSKENVVDLDAALKLIDRSKLTVADDGTVAGTDEAIAALKTGKAYLFGQAGQPGSPRVGAPSNPSNQPAPGSTSFKRSQITQEFYKANKADIDKAYAAGQIEDDGPPPAR